MKRILYYTPEGESIPDAQVESWLESFLKFGYSYGHSEALDFAMVSNWTIIDALSVRIKNGTIPPNIMRVEVYVCNHLGINEQGGFIKKNF
jgi:hypothetical protein